MLLCIRSLEILCFCKNLGLRKHSIDKPKAYTFEKGENLIIIFSRHPLILSPAHICSGRSWERWLSVYILRGRHMPCNVCYSGGSRRQNMATSPRPRAKKCPGFLQGCLSRDKCVYEKHLIHTWLLKHFIRVINQIFGILENMLSGGYHSYAFLIDYPLGCFWYRQWPYLYVFTLAGGILSRKVFQMFGQILAMKVIILSIKTRTCFTIRKPHIFRPQPCIYDIVFYCSDVVNTVFLMLSRTNPIERWLAETCSY